jgi:hypothetical protein
VRPLAGRRWEKLGRVSLATSTTHPGSHAYCPAPFSLNESTIRLFYAAPDDQGVGRIHFADVDADRPTEVIKASTEFALDVGARGRFDEHGVTPLSVVRAPDTGLTHLYYAGWQRAVGVRYFLFAGLATSADATTFERVSECPILDRCPGEELVRSSPMVTVDEDGWRMFYSSGRDWGLDPDGVDRPRYAFFETHSTDGIHWSSPGGPCAIAVNNSTAMARANVVRSADGWHMWLSYRDHGAPYRLGYAYSKDRVRWSRVDEAAGISLGLPGEWDSDEIGLGAVISTGRTTYLFYNGNGLGRTGIGVARLDEDLHVA